LERECRVWRMAGIGATAFAALVALAGSARQAEVPKVPQFERLAIRDLEAGRIVLKDEQGRRWFTLESRDGVPAMFFEGPPDGQDRRLSDGQSRGPHHIELVMNRDGVPYMAFNGGKDRGTVMFGVGPAGKPHLTLLGKGGAMTLGMGEDGLPQLGLWDKEGRQRVRLGLKPDESGGFEVLGEKDAPRSQKPQSDVREKR